MAAFSYDDYRASDEGGTFAAVLNWGGALLSLVLIAGLATWGWKLWQRDVTGVPVVRALEGPMRVAPEEPGGLASEYQGLTVNRIAESNVEAAPSEQVVLAPAPATLNEDEDLAMAELPAVAPEPETNIVANEAASQQRIAPVTEPTSIDAIALSNTIEEAAPALSSTVLEAEPESAVVATTEAAQSATDLAVAAALADLDLRPEPAVLKVEAAANVPVATPRPLVRPTNLQQVSVSAPAVQEGEVAVEQIASGTRLVQLGAFSSPDVARAEWASTEALYSDYFVDKSRVIQEVQSGGREFYRLRVMGFDDLADARRFCAVIVADGTNCIPVIHQ